MRSNRLDIVDGVGHWKLKPELNRRKIAWGFHSNTSYGLANVKMIAKARLIIRTFHFARCRVSAVEWLNNPNAAAVAYPAATSPQCRHGGPRTRIIAASNIREQRARNVWLLEHIPRSLNTRDSGKAQSCDFDSADLIPCFPMFRRRWSGAAGAHLYSRSLRPKVAYACWLTYAR